ncbi:MAG: 23S rRNA (pseudouridine(1915)-N(3))-methyltransferase RlmH [Bacteroidales bacterium]|nr:23S rRNA (pseudouridine(1915)-N(3))-methyltransferase RlmH [Bacteroidales bacterium]
MKIKLILVGKTNNSSILNLFEDYISRINRYVSLSCIIVPDVKKQQNIEKQKLKEGEAIKKQIKINDYVVLLDENGKQYSSRDFAKFLDKKMISGLKNLCFIIGGSYGFSNEIYDIAKGKISISKMTFSHQIIRPIFAEQVYRAFSILNNEPYHHD